MKFSLILLLVILTNSPVIAQTGTELCQHKQRGHKMNTAVALTDYRVSHFNLHIDTIKFTGQQLFARAGVTFVAELAPVSSINLDLLGFTIDSVYANGFNTTFSYNDTVINIQFSPAVNFGDSAEVWILYHGSPAQDASGWGGFYFNGSYAFNLGVGFQADPHNYGRAWFPCVDNFVSRSTYDFHITTAGSSKAFCNGTLQQSTVNPNGTITWHWKQSQTIPSYLASMAVGQYHTLERTSNGIPVEWAALPIDTNAVLATFVNLDTTLASFIDVYGPYPFDKVGYCLVPFNSGAMEHASSIHIGRAFVNGTQTYSTLWAHELAHMWWGDKVTCETAEDMWLNEGFASYNEAFYTKIVSGETAYNNWIRTNHRKVLQFAHTPAQDGSYLTLNNVPHANTYGYHVYQKGANIVHTMRNYMGDQAFSDGSKAYMNNRAYSHASSYDLRDELSTGSGVDMTRFFDDWVFTPGFPHFSIDSVIHIPGGLDHMFVYTRQRTKGNNNHLYEMPIEVTFIMSDSYDTTVTVVIDSVTNMFHIPIYFAPVWTVLDRFGKVSDARVSNEKFITATGVHQFPETNFSLNVVYMNPPPLNYYVRVEHNFVPPDPFQNSNPGIRLSDYHYWTVDGLFYQGFHGRGTFVFDGTTSASTGYLDNTLITGVEDSIVILYRPGAGHDWTLVNSFTINFATNPNDKRGSVTVDTLQKGEYTLGYLDYTVGIQHISTLNQKKLSVSPNPSSGIFKFMVNDKISSNSGIIIFDMGGRKVCEKFIGNANETITWDSSGIPSGMYHAVLMEDGEVTAGVKLIVSK